MTTERKPYVTERKSRFAHKYQRKQLIYFLDNLGMRHRHTNIPLVNPSQKNYIFDTIKDDLGISKNVAMRINWFETGSVFSEANDSFGNPMFNIELGHDQVPMQVSFDRSKSKFHTLFYDMLEVSFKDIAHLF